MDVFSFRLSVSGNNLNVVSLLLLFSVPAMKQNLGIPLEGILYICTSAILSSVSLPVICLRNLPQTFVLTSPITA